MENKVLYRDDHLLLIHGDCTHMVEMEDGSVDLIVTDPPFNVNFSDYGGPTNDSRKTWEYTHFTAAWLRECMRILKPGGQLYAIMSLKYMENWIQLLPKPYHILPWCRTMAHLHRGATFIRAWEPVIWIVKGGKPNTFKREYQFAADKDWWIGPSAIGESQAIRSKKRHDTPRPDWFYQDIIVRASRPGDLVLDPMVGSGTGAYVSIKLGRRFAGYDINKMYLEELTLARASQQILWPNTLPGDEELLASKRQQQFMMNYTMAEEGEDHGPGLEDR